MASALTHQESLEIRLAIEDLNSAFTYFLDHGHLDALVDLFCEDALYTHGERRSVGRAAIAELFTRRGETRRTSRHISSGVRVEIKTSVEATGSSCCLTFAADGLPPLPATPLLVADFEDVYRRCDDGRWRFRERHIKRIFVDPANPGPVGLEKG